MNWFCGKSEGADASGNNRRNNSNRARSKDLRTSARSKDWISVPMECTAPSD
jgi:hypothetical protein